MTPDDGSASITTANVMAALLGAFKHIGFTLQNALALTGSIISPILANVLGWPPSIAWSVSLLVIVWLIIGTASGLTSRKGPIWALGGALTVLLLGVGIGYWLIHTEGRTQAAPAARAPLVISPNMTFGEESPAVSGSGNRIVYGSTSPESHKEVQK